MKTPSIEQLNMAAEWLSCYDADTNEAASMNQVAEWLRAKANAADFRIACREAGVSVAIARKAIK